MTPFISEQDAELREKARGLSTEHELHVAAIRSLAERKAAERRTETPIRHKRFAHFIGPISAAATLVTGVVWVLIGWQASGEAIPFFVPMAYAIGWGLVRLWAWCRSTSLTH